MVAVALRTLVLPSLRRGGDFFWNGPADLPRELKLEWRLVAIRWLGIVFMTPALLAANLPADRFRAAYGVLLVAAVYNLSVQVFMRTRSSVFVNGYLTTMGDSLLNIAMVGVGGGFDTPFYYLLFTTTLAAAMRYGYGPSLFMTLSFISFDVVSHLPPLGASDVPMLTSSLAIRSLFLVINSLLACYLRDEAHRAEMALQERLRQANLLNEATAMLGASLELEAVLGSVAAAAAHLFGSPCVVLRPEVQLDDRGGQAARLAPVVHAAEDALAAEGKARLVAELTELCDRYGRAETWRQDGQPLRHETLVLGQRAVVLTFALPTRQVSLATLAMVVPLRPTARALDPDMLESFVNRITLAIENASLYRTLASRSQDLQRAYADLALAHQELLGVDEMKTNFIANVSHELRTPLSSIRAFSELLLTYDDPAVQQEFISIVNTESERLTRLVNDVLDISKIEAGRLDWHMESLDIGRLVRDSSRTYAPLIEKHNLAFAQEIEPDLPSVYGDRDRLHQVLGNLLNNAVKFTDSGTITLRATRVGEQVHVSVSDTGIGIAAEDHERIFEKFQQVGEMLTDKPHGTGLGLAISKDIIAYHKGQLWVESEPGVGSTFTVALNAAVATPVARQQEVAAAVGAVAVAAGSR